MRDCYEVLGVERNADQNTIKRAYRKLAMMYHPDRNPDDPDAPERFKEATEAYEILRDPETRARYDRFGHAGVGSRSGARTGGFSEFDLSDALRAFMRDFGGFEDLFGRGRSGRSAGPLRGSDVQLKIRVPLEDVATGIEKTIKAKLLHPCEACQGSGSTEGGKPEPCSTCSGRGEVRQSQRSVFGQFVNVRPCPRCRGEGRIVTDPCDGCAGEGRVRRERRIRIRIPAGVESGNYLTLRGEGNVGPRGGPPGDLLVVIEVEEHATFRRHGEDVVMELPVSFPQAALGAVVEIPTLEGTTELRVPPGTQPGEVLRVVGMGVPPVGGGPRGDQLVQIDVWVPERLNDEERAHLEALADSENLAAPTGPRGFWRRMKEAFTA